MPINHPPQNSLFYERDVLCQISIIEKWPHRAHPVDRWHIRQSIKALRSMRAARSAYNLGLRIPMTYFRPAFTHRVEGRTKRKQLQLPM